MMVLTIQAQRLRWNRPRASASWIRPYSTPPSNRPCSEAIFTPALAWILITYGWKEIFYVTGVAGTLVAAIWYAFYRDPVVSSPTDATKDAAAPLPFFVATRAILTHRQVWGMFIGQFSVQTTLFFFLTWFPTLLGLPVNTI